MSDPASTATLAVNIKHFDEHFSVSGEFTPQSLAAIVTTGIDTLINVRPDNEAKDQINSLQWQQLTQAHKLHYVHIPVTPGQYTAEDIAKFKAALLLSKTGVHSFCRTGTRAAHLWALANKEERSYKALHHVLHHHGYDLDMINSMFSQQSPFTISQ